MRWQVFADSAPIYHQTMPKTHLRTTACLSVKSPPASLILSSCAFNAPWMWSWRFQLMSNHSRCLFIARRGNSISIRCFRGVWWEEVTHRLRENAQKWRAPPDYSQYSLTVNGGGGGEGCGSGRGFSSSSSSSSSSLDCPRMNEWSGWHTRRLTSGNRNSASRERKQRFSPGLQKVKEPVHAFYYKQSQLLFFHVRHTWAQTALNKHTRRCWKYPSGVPHAINVLFLLWDLMTIQHNSSGHTHAYTYTLLLGADSPQALSDSWCS